MLSCGLTAHNFRFHISSLLSASGWFFLADLKTQVSAEEGEEPPIGPASPDEWLEGKPGVAQGINSAGPVQAALHAGSFPFRIGLGGRGLHPAFT